MKSAARAALSLADLLAMGAALGAMRAASAHDESPDPGEGVSH